MSLKTFSAFYYGHDVTDSNRIINFSEGAGPELQALIDIGSYTLTDYLNKVLVALNDVGNLTYTGSIDRVTRKLTITATGTFSLILSGPGASVSALPLMGFTSTKSGASSYESDVASGYVYEPQFKLQRFVDFSDFVETSDSTVNTSASGVVEVVNYGLVNRMECNIRFITDIIGQGAIKNNPNGVSDLRNFMLYATKKKPLEFIKDIDNPSVFNSCILDKTRTSANGTGFQLDEMYSQGLANYFETGILTFREI